MKRLSIVFAIIGLFLSCFGCNKKGTEEPQKTLIIGHRGIGVGVNDGCIENTMEAYRKALSYSDGVEVDIQMSASNSLWIYHDDLLNDLCDTSAILLDIMNYNCILNSTDEVLEQVRICREGLQDRIYKLEEIFEEVSKDQSKTISLDVKGYFDASCISTKNVDQAYQFRLAEELYALVKKYNVQDQITVQTAYTHIFERIKELDKNIQCYYLIFENMAEKIDYAIEKDADGLSLNLQDSTLNQEQIKIAKDKGLTIELWTIRTEEDLQKALKLNTHAVEVSNFDLLKSIHKNGLDKYRKTSN